MQTVDCNVALGGDIRMSLRKRNVTIAELVVIQAIHGRDAVTDVTVTGEVVDFSPTGERERLRALYELTEKSVSIATLFPGVKPQMPLTLAEVVLTNPEPDEDSRTLLPPNVRRLDGSRENDPDVPEDDDDPADDDADESAPPPGVDAPEVDPFG